MENMTATISYTSSCLLLLLLILFSDHPSVTGTSISDIANTAARVMNRARKAKQSKMFLHAHNVARLSSGVPPLEWDRDLARFAHKWAKQRKPDCNMLHSNGPYGENLFWYRKTKTWSPERIVTKWFEERFSYDSKANTCASGQMCGHYTQIVWRDTTAVGCARVKCDGGRGFLVVCEYDPRGNYEGESPFERNSK